MSRPALWGAHALLLLTCVAYPSSGYSHGLRLGIFAVEELAQDTYRIRWTVALPQGETPHPHRSPELPANCDLRETSRFENEGAQTWTSTARCPGGLAGATLRVSANLPILLHWRPGAGEPVSKLLRDHGGSLHLPHASEGTRSTLEDYFALGVRHIAEGFDHLLFVLGLVLLISRLRALAWAVTSFTLGHSVSLALATFGTASLPSGPVEVVIALSVLLLAVEVSMFDRGAPPTVTRRYPQWAAACFGLVHGLGFAGALEETGLPQEGVGWALAGFNLGVEAGQLLFVVGMALLIRGLSKHVAQRHLRLAMTYVMGGAATYWTLERLAGWI